jgi:endo-1,4-beta-xylanase
VGHFKGKIYAWDVVNEALGDDGTRRSSTWSAIGTNYIEEAFKAARAADPAALLFYNDYNLEFPGAKQDAAFALLQDLKGKGLVDGVGFESHFQVNTGGGGVPSQSTMSASIARFAALGLKVHLTELDIRIPATAGSTETNAQAAGYTGVVAACRAIPACEAIVIWGLDDGDSWIPGTFPGYGSATLFDASFNKKATYTAVKSSL